MECWYVMVEYSLVVASIFSFRTLGQWNTGIIKLRLHFVLVVTLYLL